MSNLFKQYPVGSPRKVFGLANINTYKAQPFDMKVIQSLKQLDQRAGSIQSIQKQRKKRKQYMSMSVLNNRSILNKSQDAKAQALEMFSIYKKTKQQIIKKQSYLLPKLKIILKDEINKNDEITNKQKKQKQILIKRQSLKKLNRISMMKQEQQTCLQNFKNKCSEQLDSVEFSLNVTLLKTQTQNSYFFSNAQRSYLNEHSSIFDDNLLNQQKEEVLSQKKKFKLLNNEKTTKSQQIGLKQQTVQCNIPKFLMKVLNVNQYQKQNSLFLTNSSQIQLSGNLSINKNRKSRGDSINQPTKLR